MKYYLFFVIAAFLITSCSDETEKDRKVVQSKVISRFNFPDILQISGFPEKKTNDSLQLFFDLGSWHGFSLPKPDDTLNFGAFAGPYLLDQYNSGWLVKYATRISICNPESFPGCDYTNVKINSFPGILCQEFTTGYFRVKLDLIFISPNTSLLRAIVKNTAGKSGSFTLNLESGLFDSDKNNFFVSNNELIYKEKNNIVSVIPGKSFNMKSFKENSSGCLVSSDLINLKPGESYKSFSYISVYTVSDSLDKKFLKEVPEWLMDKNNKRWNGYLEKISFKSTRYLQIAVKCLQTLIANWRSPRGALKHEGVIPSWSYNGFHGFWAWDSWKHAPALALFEPELAKNQIRAMFDYQDSAGMIVDCIFPDTLQEPVNRRNTKPPLAGWSVWKVFEVTGDTAFLKEMFPKLIKYHEWWYKYRDNDQNGLCEFGSCDGTRIAAAWESGMDNAVRFDKAVMVKNKNGGYSLDQESVDLNTFLWLEKNYLKKIALTFDVNPDSSFSEGTELMLGKKIIRTFYDPDAGYFFDRNTQSGAFIRIFGPEGWLPLWAGLATRERAKKVKEKMMDKYFFLSRVPLPTLAVNHSEFSPEKGYWRGPVWLDQVYFGIAGLKNFGFTEDADKIKKLIFQNLENQKNQPLFENYHPLTGQGLNARNFSWTAAHLLMILMEE